MSDSDQYHAANYPRQNRNIDQDINDPEAPLPEVDNELYAQEIYRVMGWDVNNPPQPKEALRQLDEHFVQAQEELDLEGVWEQVEREDPAWANPELPEDRSFSQEPRSDFER